MDSNPIYHPSPANKMKYSFLDYIQLLMISWAGRWTQTPFITPLQPKKWSAHFLIMFNFWWAAGLVNELKPHPPALSSQKNEMLLFGLRSTSDDRLGWSMDSNPILHLSPAKEMKSPFLYYVQLLMIGWAGRWTQTPSTTPLQPKQWNAHFCITFNIWCWPDWSMDLNLIHHSSPAKKMKCSIFWVMFIFWWLAQAGQWTQTPSITPLQPKKWNTHFWITSTSDDQPMGWNARFWITSTSDVGPGHWTQTPSITPLQPIKWNAHFWIMFNFWWSAGLVDGLLETPSHHPSPANKMKCSFFDHVQLLMISWAGQWTQTPSTSPLQPKKWNAHFLHYVQLLMISWAGQWTQTPSSTSLQPKKWNAHFCIMFNF